MVIQMQGGSWELIGILYLSCIARLSRRAHDVEECIERHSIASAEHIYNPFFYGGPTLNFSKPPCSKSQRPILTTFFFCLRPIAGAWGCCCCCCCGVSSSSSSPPIPIPPSIPAKGPILPNAAGSIPMLSLRLMLSNPASNAGLCGGKRSSIGGNSTFRSRSTSGFGRRWRAERDFLASAEGGSARTTADEEASSFEAVVAFLVRGGRGGGAPHTGWMISAMASSSVFSGSGQGKINIRAALKMTKARDKFTRLALTSGDGLVHRFAVVVEQSHLDAAYVFPVLRVGLVRLQVQEDMPGRCE